MTLFSVEFNYYKYDNTTHIQYNMTGKMRETQGKRTQPMGLVIKKMLLSF